MQRALRVIKLQVTDTLFFFLKHFLFLDMACDSLNVYRQAREDQKTLKCTTPLWCTATRTSCTFSRWLILHLSNIAIAIFDFSLLLLCKVILFESFLVSILCFFFYVSLSKVIALPTIAIAIVVALSRS